MPGARAAKPASAESPPSIAAHGLLRSRVQRPRKGGRFEVVAGGRRPATTRGCAAARLERRRLAARGVRPGHPRRGPRARGRAGRDALAPRADRVLGGCARARAPGGVVAADMGPLLLDRHDASRARGRTPSPSRWRARPPPAEWAALAQRSSWPTPRPRTWRRSGRRWSAPPFPRADERALRAGAGPRTSTAARRRTRGRHPGQVGALLLRRGGERRLTRPARRRGGGGLRRRNGAVRWDRPGNGVVLAGPVEEVLRGEVALDR